jgi:sugar phosphate isomerase/epimerase
VGSRHDSRKSSLAVVTEAFLDRSLIDLMDWLADAVPQVTGLELGSGGYAPHPHCDRAELLRDPQARSRWAHEIATRGFGIAALNAWGNPLHPDAGLASRHDADLRDTIRLAGQLGIDRVVALAGCPAGAPGDRMPHFAGGGWLPYLEGVYDTQWEQVAAPYWSDLSDFARSEHPELLICLELHPGTLVYNVETFSRLARLGANLAANVDPSHFFWQHMDTETVVGALGGRVGHAHAKDVAFNEHALATSGLLDHRWPGATSEMPWSFATVGQGHDAAWWAEFVGWLDGAPVGAIAIEHEDPDVAPEVGVVAAAEILAAAAEIQGLTASAPGTAEEGR